MVEAGFLGLIKEQGWANDLIASVGEAKSFSTIEVNSF